ncbi:hypothetical protein Q3V30_01280 [Erwinia pyri]|uniref:Uncharacterized protein n=1 Tax=Erwinia pyri TaxID=3062598 RepID=A0AA50DJP8_9GAMM|nr:hypothetical protein [Erwinia sp. DE2]WLS79179.1 hypothetical protein Q3V30_01280 [Erwinia sp. DE2]
MTKINNALKVAATDFCRRPAGAITDSFTFPRLPAIDFHYT